MRSILSIAAGDLVSKALLVGINLYLIRHLSVDQYSHFSLLLNVIFLGYQLVCGPLERLYIAEHDLYRAHLTWLQWFLSVVIALAMMIWLWHEIDWADALLILLGIFLLATYQVLRIRFQQRLAFKLFSLADIFKNAMWVVFLVLFLSIPLMPPGISSLLALLAGTFVSMCILAFGSASKLPLLQHSVPLKEMANVLWGSRYVIAYSMVGALIPYLPVMMANSIGDDTIIATYGAAMRYQAILGMAVFAFNAVLLPKMALLGRNGKERSLMMKRLKLAAPLALLLFMATILVIWLVIPFIDQGKYPLLQSVFLIMSIPPALSLVGTPYINMLLVDGKARTVLVCMSAGLAINLVGYFLLLSSQSSLAPGWASLLAYLTITIAVIIYATKERREAA
jgi:O-antigen/teichoic acid export membrane protein